MNANKSEVIYLVTGATAGIGLAVATALAKQGVCLVMAGRQAGKTEALVQQLRAESGNTAIHALLADFADLQQVTEMAAEFMRRFGRLDVLVNNAGAFFNTRRPAPNGMELTFHVNHLAPFLLTNLLLGCLQESPSARIVNVASEVHRQDDMDFNNLGFQHRYIGIRAYARSKLANILFTYELARRLEGSRVCVNALHPGHVATNIWRNDFSFMGPALSWFMRRIALSPEQGADNTLFLATSPEVEGVTGKYFVKRQVVDSSTVSYDLGVAQRLWQISEELMAA